MLLCKKRITKALIRLHGCAGWSASELFANPRRQVFSRGGPYSFIQYSLDVNHVIMQSLTYQFFTYNIFQKGIFVNKIVFEEYILITKDIPGKIC